MINNCNHYSNIDFSILNRRNKVHLYSLVLFYRHRKVLQSSTSWNQELYYVKTQNPNGLKETHFYTSNDILYALHSILVLRWLIRGLSQFVDIPFKLIPKRIHISTSILIPFKSIPKRIHISMSILILMKWFKPTQIFITYFTQEVEKKVFFS